MNFFRRLIARAFPPEAGMPHHSLRWPGVPNSPNPTPTNDLTARSRAEQEVRSNGDAKRILSALIGGLVGGSGLTPMLRDPELRRLWDTWGEKWIPQLQQITETMIVSGEAFVLLGVSERPPGVPLELTILPPEFLDTSKNNGKDTIAGIVFDGTRQIGYWLFKSHPAIPGTELDSILVSSDDCLHVYRPVRPTDQRGETWFSPVLYLMRLKREYLEADLTRQKTSALLAGFVRSPSGTLNPFATPGNPNGSMISLEPATMTMLPAECEITFSNPVDHGAAFDPFMKHVTRQIFAGMNLPYELCGDLGNVTFASGRAGILEFRRQIESVQFGVLIPLLCAPILRRWLELANALGYTAAADERPRWACPSPQALDSRMEVQTDILRVRAGFASRREIVEANGWNIEDVDSEIAADQERARNLGLTLDVDSQRTQQGQEQSQETP